MSHTRRSFLARTLAAAGAALGLSQVEAVPEAATTPVPGQWGRSIPEIYASRGVIAAGTLVCWNPDGRLEPVKPSSANPIAGVALENGGLSQTLDITLDGGIWI